MDYRLFTLVLAFLGMSMVAISSRADTTNQNQNGGVGNVQNVGGYVNSPGAGSPSATGVGVAHSYSNASSKSYNTNVANQGQSADNKGNNLKVEQNYAAEKRSPVGPAIAAPIYPTANCSAVSSLAIQGIGLGAGIASSYDSANCVAWNDANGLATKGFHKAAVKRLCMESNLADALAAEVDEKTGKTPCSDFAGKGGGLFDVSPSAGQPDNRVTAPSNNLRAIDRQ